MRDDEPHLVLFKVRLSAKSHCLLSSKHSAGSDKWLSVLIDRSPLPMRLYSSILKFMTTVRQLYAL